MTTDLARASTIGVQADQVLLAVAHEGNEALVADAGLGLHHLASGAGDALEGGVQLSFGVEVNQDAARRAGAEPGVDHQCAAPALFRPGEDAHERAVEVLAADWNVE